MQPLAGCAFLSCRPWRVAFGVRGSWRWALPSVCWSGFPLILRGVGHCGGAGSGAPCRWCHLAMRAGALVSVRRGCPGLSGSRRSASQCMAPLSSRLSRATANSNSNSNHNSSNDSNSTTVAVATTFTT
eukprot:15474020-Alexandrium_andersonii.AAC.1